MNKITNYITQGLYVITTNGGGCIVDAVSQISGGDNPLIAVSIMKKNNTCELLKRSKKFALTVLGEKVDGRIIETFGYHSSKDYDKFANDFLIDDGDFKIVKDGIAYMTCEIVDHLDAEDHELFIGKLLSSEVSKDKNVMTYNYFTEHKDKIIKVRTDAKKTAWVCTFCGYVYYGEKLPAGFVCPVCGVGPEFFKKMN
jgi:flavin reductase (DIM6/NTAB) family NADH-FMN oxidoreductase RutF/rubredoxin